MGDVVRFPQDEERHLTLRIVQVLKWQTEAMGRRFWRSAMSRYRSRLLSDGLDVEEAERRVLDLAAQVEAELSARADAGAPLPYEAA